MKKFIVLFFAVCFSVTLFGQTIISANDYEAQHKVLATKRSECFKTKDYVTGEKLTLDAIALYNRLSKENQREYLEKQSGNYYDLACVYSLQKQTTKAVDAFEKAIAYYAPYRKGRVTEWNYSHAQKDSDLDYIRNNQRFIALMGAKAAIERGVTAAESNNYEKAIAECTEAIKLHPNYAEAYVYRGMIYYMVKDYDRAIADYNQAIRLDNNHNTAYYNRAFIYLHHKKDYDRAIEDFTQLIRLFPNDGDNYRSRGHAYRGKGDYSRAKADYESALRVNPQDNLAKNALNELSTPSYQGTPSYQSTPSSGSNQIKCNTCNGSGICRSCNGTGGSVCSYCNGNGKKVYGYGTNQSYETCVTCKGTGKNNCAICRGNSRCNQCHGKGYINY